MNLYFALALVQNSSRFSCSFQPRGPSHFINVQIQLDFDKSAKTKSFRPSQPPPTGSRGKLRPQAQTAVDVAGASSSHQQWTCTMYLNSMYLNSTYRCSRGILVATNGGLGHSTFYYMEQRHLVANTDVAGGFQQPLVVDLHTVRTFYYKQQRHLVAYTDLEGRFYYFLIASSPSDMQGKQ